MRGGCELCGAKIYLPVAYFRVVWALALFILAVAGAVTYCSDHAGTWLLILLLVAVPSRVIFGLLIPPWFVLNRPHYRIPFSVWYVSICVGMFVYWQIYGWTALALGATKIDMREHFEMISMPLGWITPNLIITPERTFFDVCGILFGNTFFYALGTFLLYRTVHAVLRKGAPIQIDIAGGNSDK